ncbi:hypothetical protein P4U99_27625 [Brevibacillus agri]|uniref:hypothetical protein n=1 Tax=Brevibacillus agri TaxID=51101 RepID=UPI001EE53CE0|nr:hypothetical protein [Brevibacillus agri]MCG5252467.1 hypothetical protein [Brevibacillus agri]MED1646876.1 hypothetical protein [Brevibacillus agri]MED1657622.1 hypothetical protein [Brevibacillus agri]MED1690046.1 hypothetical protein [Brevibacillus agri]MED1691663.1 hypothetical protein [Brevibacillus agri]
MGQFLQLGIIHKLAVSKEKMNALGLSVEKVKDELNKEVDMALYDLFENDDVITFVLKESFVMQQLSSFLRFQYSLYDQDGFSSFETAIQAISALSNLQQIVEMAEEKRFPCFQNNRIAHDIQVSNWKSLRVEISLFVIFLEGKIFMECCDSFLNFITKAVRESSKQWSISGAFGCFID